MPWEMRSTKFKTKRSRNLRCLLPQKKECVEKKSQNQNSHRVKEENKNPNQIWKNFSFIPLHLIPQKAFCLQVLLKEHEVEIKLRLKWMRLDKIFTSSVHRSSSRVCQHYYANNSLLVYKLFNDFHRRQEL